MTMSAMPSPDQTRPVADNPDRSRFEIFEGAHVAGFAAYQRGPGEITFTHTEVEPAYEGQGMAGDLVRAALDQVRAEGLRVVPRCPYVKKWISRHPDYQDLVGAPT
jgi:uncharacterized protein